MNQERVILKEEIKEKIKFLESRINLTLQSLAVKWNRMGTNAYCIGTPCPFCKDAFWRIRHKKGIEEFFVSIGYVDLMCIMCLCPPQICSTHEKGSSERSIIGKMISKYPRRTYVDEMKIKDYLKVIHAFTDLLERDIEEKRKLKSILDDLEDEED